MRSERRSHTEKIGIFMNKRIILSVAAIGIAALALAGCSSAATGTSGGSAPAATGATLATGKTSLGTIVVDGKGDSVYVFTSDTANSGKSTCNDACASSWPAVATTSSAPDVKGVTGTVGEITRTDGTKQVTLDGMPLYTYAGDSAAGDVAGQGMGNTWYVVTPAGKQVSKAPSSDSSSGGSGSGGGWS
jgi:predicted lipoprotein with Yx(FWY)xxD motif